VVPESYLQPGALDSTVKPLGHAIFVILVFDLDCLVRNVNDEDLRSLQMTPEQAHARALANLEALAKAKKVKMAVLPHGPSGTPFILVCDHWAAATSILLPRLRGLAEASLGTREICVSIPHREAMLVFAKGDRPYRDAMRALVKEKESDGRKPLTFELFTLEDEGVKPFKEGE
jgi:hypothetical protein